MTQYSTKMIFAVLDVSLIMGLKICETDSFFTLIIHNQPNTVFDTALLLQDGNRRNRKQVTTE